MIEKFYRRIIDGVPSAVVVVDQNLKAVFKNATFCQLFGDSSRRAKLGGAFGCAHDCKQCGVSDCAKNCSLITAFEDAFYSTREISRRVYLKLNGAEKREVAFSLTVKPLGGGLSMGVIDDALELEIARELQTAKNIQQRLLPAGKWAGGKRYSYLYIPCREIGGDLPEVFTVGSSACGMIADVSGKGVAAGMLTAFVKAAYDKTAYSPAQAITALSHKFSELNLDERNYITVAAARIDKDSITYSTAGHNVPILLKSGGGITRIVLNSPPVANWFDNAAYFEDTIPYSSGDILVLLTDGVTESKNKFGEMFGVDGAIKTLSVSRTGEEFIKNLETNLKSFCGELHDDVTAIAFDL
ncbi:MAG: SpoIIE family protein phosphatase [Clostridia bacterium]|nr:SpoIIE family protein phosphatase [Clostridia bacterium]